MNPAVKIDVLRDVFMSVPPRTHVWRFDCHALVTLIYATLV
jgi:hypothetical protein